MHEVSEIMAWHACSSIKSMATAFHVINTCHAMPFFFIYRSRDGHAFSFSSRYVQQAIACHGAEFLFFATE